MNILFVASVVYLAIAIITHFAAPHIFQETMGDEDNFTVTALAWPMSLTAGLLNEYMYRQNFNRWRRGAPNCREDITLFKDDVTYNLSEKRLATLKLRWEENAALDRHAEALGTK